MVKPGNWHLAFDRIKKKAAEPSNTGTDPTYPAKDAKGNPAPAKQINNSQPIPIRETAAKAPEEHAAEEANGKKQTLTRKAIGAIGLLHKAKSYAEELAKLQ